MRLYPRRHGLSMDAEVQERAAAHRLLDRLRAGESVPAERVRWALRATGDLDDEAQALAEAQEAAA